MRPLNDPLVQDVIMRVTRNTCVARSHLHGDSHDAADAALVYRQIVEVNDNLMTAAAARALCQLDARDERIDEVVAWVEAQGRCTIGTDSWPPMEQVAINDAVARVRIVQVHGRLLSHAFIRKLGVGDKVGFQVAAEHINAGEPVARDARGKLVKSVGPDGVERYSLVMPNGTATRIP